MNLNCFPVIIAVLGVMLTAQSCDMLESSPYDGHISGERQLTHKNTRLIEQQTAGKDCIRFAMISDTQLAYDETVDAVRAINEVEGIDFVLHGGDLTEYGATKEFLWQRDILARLSVPYVCVIGNHDCLATGLDTYASLYGPLNFSFTAGNVRFLCLNTNDLEFDHFTYVPDMAFIKHELETVTPEIEKTVVLMHAGPFSEQFNNNIAEEFHALLCRFPGLQFCVYGHSHHVDAADLFGDGVIYYQCANVAKRSFLLFTINADDTYDYEVVEF